MICPSHQWTKKKFPCPWIRCPHGVRGHWVVLGKKKRVVYARARIKDGWGPRYDWEKTALNPDDLMKPEPDDEEEDLVF